MKTKTIITKAALAKDLAVSPALITKFLAHGRLQERSDGLIDVEQAIQSLYVYWSPSAGWHEKKRVGPIGRELRRRWQAEIAAEGGYMEEIVDEGSLSRGTHADPLRTSGRAGCRAGVNPATARIHNRE